MQPSAPKSRKHVIPIRYKTPSRQKIVLIVAQQQDAIGNWMVPTITTSERIPLILESGQFAADLGRAYSTAASIHAEWMLEVEIVDAQNNQQTDPVDDNA